MRKLSLVGVVIMAFIGSGYSQTVVPLRKCGKHGLIAKGQIGQWKELNFLIDTGAAPSVLSNRMAKKMALALRRSSLLALDHTVDAGEAVLASVEVGPIHATDLTVNVADLSQLETSFGARIDLVAGLDLLARMNFAIDYRHNTLTFGGTPHQDGVPYEWVSNGSAHYVLLHVDVNGMPADLLLDTGAGDMILFERRLPELRRLARGIASAATAAGPSAVSILSAPSLKLGKRQLRVAEVFVLAATTGPDFDGIVGPRAIGVQWLEFDFQRGTVSLAFD
jgi:predicted aspartyl protease